MNGAYVLLLKINSKKNIKVGRLGRIVFNKGFYCYVGSAIGRTTIENRCKRHLKKMKKKRWHIDYLIRKTEIISIVAFSSKRKIECKIAIRILKISDGFVPKFGSTDCNCKSHLFYFRNEKSLFKLYPIFSKGIRIYSKF